MVLFSGAKVAKAFAIGLVMSGLAAGCNEASQVAKTIAPEAEAVSVSAGKSTQSAQLTAEEIDAKKREFFAKPEVKEMSAGLEEIAEAVAVAVEDKDLRDRIYAKCMEKFDGETNVLWQQLEGDNNLRAKGGWNKRIDDHLNNGRKNATVKGIGSVDAAVKKFEKIVNAPLHLFWMYPSQWDKKTTPLIAFLPFDADPNVRPSIPAFDSKGNRFELDRKGELAKKRPVIVITVNERTGIDGKLRSNTFSTSSIEIQGAPNSKGSSSTQSTSRISFSSASIPYWNDPEWEGNPEFFYVFNCGQFWNNSNQWLGTNPLRAGWVNKKINGQGNVDLPSHPFDIFWGPLITVQFRYYEADFLAWDDLVEVHTITNSGGSTYQDINAVHVIATYVAHN